MKIIDKKPDFDNFLNVLKRDPNAKPALFEMFMNVPLYEKLAGRQWKGGTALDYLKLVVDAFANAGYDYATTHACDLAFPTNERAVASSYSANDGTIIGDRVSFDHYNWPDPELCDYSALEDIKGYLPDGMKLMVMGPGGVLETVMALVGYDNLCYMLYEDPVLLADIFEAIGSRFVRYYEKSAGFDSVGVLMSNDDWGFNTQTFLSLEDMRKYVFPWHKKIVEAGHKAGKPVLLHSCGYMGEVMEDIIGLGYDGKHSYETNIIPVEESYRRWGERITILGGIDLDFIVRATEEEIRCKSREILDLTKGTGGYMLGSGNSIPDYVPDSHYFTMIQTLTERD